MLDQRGAEIAVGAPHQLPTAQCCRSALSTCCGRAVQSVRVRLPTGSSNRDDQTLTRVRDAVLTFLGLLVLFVALGLVVVVLFVKVLPWIAQALPGDGD